MTEFNLADTFFEIPLSNLPCFLSLTLSYFSLLSCNDVILPGYDLQVQESNLSLIAPYNSLVEEEIQIHPDVIYPFARYIFIRNINLNYIIEKLLVSSTHGFIREARTKVRPSLSQLRIKRL